MFKDVLTQVTGILNRRFLLNTLFPSFIFWGLLLAVIIFGQGYSIPEITNSWNKQETTLKIIQLIIFLSLVAFSSSILSSQQTRILRFYEGYWNLPFLENISKRWYKLKHEKLDQQIDVNSNDPCYQDIYLRYPPRKQRQQVMPTRLGNILKNLELYPRQRYMIDAVLIWPRLYQLLPENLLQSIAEAKSSLDLMLVISWLSGLFAFVSGIYLLSMGAAWWFFLVCFWGGLLVAWLAYQGALASAILYAHQIKTAFDLYRNELFKQMRWQLPTNLEDEKKKWETLCQFLYRNFPGDWNYSSDNNNQNPSQQQPSSQQQP